MLDLKGKTAVVTGAAFGIGAGAARRFAQLGMNVVLADIQAEPLQAYCNQLASEGLSVAAMPTDVSDPEAIARLADFAEARFGAIHLMFNNAGIAMHGVPLAQIPLSDWQWVMDVNIRSVTNSIHHVMPRMLRHGQPGWFINTASIGGLQVNRGWYTGAYSMTKYAVVALSEGLAWENKDSAIRVMVLCPGAVATSLAGNAVSRPERLGGPTERPTQAFLAQAIGQGISPDLAAQRLISAMENQEFFVFTDSTARPRVEERHHEIQQAFEDTDAFWRSRT